MEENKELKKQEEIYTNELAWLSSVALNPRHYYLLKGLSMRLCRILDRSRSSSHRELIERKVFRKRRERISKLIFKTQQYSQNMSDNMKKIRDLRNTTVERIFLCYFPIKLFSKLVVELSRILRNVDASSVRDTIEGELFEGERKDILGNVYAVSRYIKDSRINRYEKEMAIEGEIEKEISKHKVELQ